LYSGCFSGHFLKPPIQNNKKPPHKPAKKLPYKSRPQKKTRQGAKLLALSVSRDFPRQRGVLALGAAVAETLVKAIYPAAGIKHLLLTGEKRVAL
jgi:hypothetical protein